MILATSIAVELKPHRSLIAKLRQLNINEFLHKWIVDYLTDRTQCIGVEGATFLSQPVLSGVPQGSVLGPLLFIIYIDGLTNALSNSSMSLYADDLLSYRTIQSPTDYQTLQAEIDSLSNWISSHKLQLNCDKCKCMFVTHKRNSTMPTVLLVNSEPLERVHSYKYLGIQLTSDLSWSAHISTLCSKARKFYRYSDMDRLKQLYVAFIHPHLEYATAVGDLHLSKDILELESVQRFACRVCTKSWLTVTCCLP